MNINLLISLLSLCLSLVVGMFVYFQLRYFVRQIKFNSVLEVTRANRDLTIYAMENPDLLQVVPSIYGENPDPGKEMRTRYCQLWINQAYFAWSAHRINLLPKGDWKAYESDIAVTFRREEYKERWPHVRKFYPSEFRAYVDKLLMTEPLQQDK